MKLKFLLFALAALAVTTNGIAADTVQARGILVAASNEKRDPDPRLAEYEPTLRSFLSFESYRFVGSGNGRAEAPGETTISIGQGHRLVIGVESITGNQIRARVSWQNGGKTFMNTVLVLRRGVPMALGGPKSGNETLAVILVVS
jgi:hypothetical protein